MSYAKDKYSEKDLNPIFVTESGMNIDIKDKHPEKQ
jgi:hypothetical protein